MKTASLNDIKKELSNQDSAVLLEYCLRLAKFKKENKELLQFLLFEAQDISTYVNEIKSEIEEQFLQMNKSNIYLIKKSVRKILRSINKQIRFSISKQVEAELLIQFCNCIIKHSIPIKKSRQLNNIYENQLKKIDKTLASLHPDLQYDLKRELIL
jgi:hypothetical protein